MAIFSTKWISFVIAMSGTCISAFANAYGVYINDLKTTFNFTQILANLPGSFGSFGCQMGLPAAFILETFGYRWTHVFAMVLSVLPCLALASATYSANFYHKYPGLLYVYYFLQGFGSASMYMSYLRWTMVNFSGDSMGKIIGLIGASLCIGPLVCTVIYQLVSSDGQYLGVFFIIVGVLFFVLNLLSILLISEDETRSGELMETINPSDDNEDNEGLGLLPDHKPSLINGKYRNITLPQVMCSLPFLILASLDIIGRADLGALLLMLGSLAQSLQLDHLIGFIGTLGPIISIIGSISLGLISDRYIHKIPRVSYLFAFTILLILLSILSIWFTRVLFLPTILLIYLVYSLYNMFIPILLREYFDIENVTKAFGFAITFQAFSQTFLSWLSGWLYEQSSSYQREHTNNDCVGETCLHTILISVILIQSLCFILLAYLCFRRPSN